MNELEKQFEELRKVHPSKMFDKFIYIIDFHIDGTPECDDTLKKLIIKSDETVTLFMATFQQYMKGMEDSVTWDTNDFNNIFLPKLREYRIKDLL